MMRLGELEQEETKKRASDIPPWVWVRQGEGKRPAGDRDEREYTDRDSQELPCSVESRICAKVCHRMLGVLVQERSQRGEDQGGRRQTPDRREGARTTRWRPHKEEMGDEYRKTPARRSTGREYRRTPVMVELAEMGAGGRAGRRGVLPSQEEWSTGSRASGRRRADEVECGRDWG